MDRVEELITELRNGNWLVRRRAAESLGKTGDLRAVEPLCQALEDEDEWVRAWTVEALERINDTRAVAPLCRRLEDKNYAVSWRAAKALGRLRQREALPALRAYLHRTLDRWCRQAIEQIEKATESTKDLPLPAAAPALDVDALLRSAGALGFDADKLPRPADRKVEGNGRG